MPEHAPESQEEPIIYLPAGQEMSGTLRGAYEGVVEHHTAGALQEPVVAAPAPPRGWIVATAATWLTLVTVLIFPPAFARVPASEPFTSPAALRDASLRFGLWLARHRVADFTAAAMRLPSFAGEAGIDDPAIGYEVSGERDYLLTAHEQRARLELSSRMSADSFLGESVRALAASRDYQQAGIPGRTTAR